MATQGSVTMLTAINEALTSTTKSVTTAGTLTTPSTAPLFSATAGKKYYFAYGSNLSTTQMASRCAGARPLHQAWIGGWKFIINTRGVANIVPDTIFNTATGTYNPGVFGLLYEINDNDEEILDMCEGVPQIYEKVEMLVWLRAAPGQLQPQAGLGEEQGLARRAMVYVDTQRTEEGSPRAEYVARMNRAIQEAGIQGSASRLPLPTDYVVDVMRCFIPFV